jgi:ABC-type uncharacterized transport system substrate-binding protein
MTIVRAALAVALALGLLALPLTSETQQATKVWRIGYLGYAYPTEARDLEAFRQRLRDLGYVEGKNLVIESRLAESSFERLPALAAELVSLKVDVIAAYGNQTIMALTRATQTIPIVMIVAGDPVGTGLVRSLAHPGGNVTGLAQGLIVLPNPVTLMHQAQILELAAKDRLPPMYPWREFTGSGGLMAYSTNRAEMYRRSVTFVDKILRGAKPADLPIEQPTKFELVINLKTAKALGLTIPPSVLLRADRVIE